MCFSLSRKFSPEAHRRPAEAERRQNQSRCVSAEGWLIPGEFDFSRRRFLIRDVGHFVYFVVSCPTGPCVNSYPAGEAAAMEITSLLHKLHLSSSPSDPLPAITELLSQLQKKLIGADHNSCESSSVVGQVEHLFQTADPDWLFPSVLDDQKNEWVELRSAYKSVISTLIGWAALPICEDDCSSLDSAAYQSIPSRATAVCSALTALLGSWDEGCRARRDKTGLTGLLLTVAPPIFLFSVTHFQMVLTGPFVLQDQPWSTASSRTAARHLHEALVRVGGWRDSAHLLMGDEYTEDRGILGRVLDVLLPQLTNLMMMKMMSVCVQPAADLRQFNRAEVLYQALFKHLYTSEAAVIQLVLSCLLDLLLILEKPPSSASHRKPCRHDDVLRLVLTHMEVEHKVALRRVYASALPLYVERMGVAVCKHLRRVERVVLGYLEVRDPPEETSRLMILEVLQRTIKVAWPR
ncbi:hypothetical protein XENOCAPTIV_005357 [Xenoophorus captivus]|uniref:TELO2 interacting protein 2 n=1 Tax=Xenoophorus captivus TaxID=1517983 RepID=A0ABV0QYT1_9TELE